jgi:hypothetical protein
MRDSVESKRETREEIAARRPDIGRALAMTTDELLESLEEAGKADNAANDDE